LCEHENDDEILLGLREVSEPESVDVVRNVGIDELESVDLVDNGVFIIVALAMVLFVREVDSDFLVNSAEDSDGETIEDGWQVLEVHRDAASVGDVVFLIVRDLPQSLGDLD
jgi:hypothetical protein